MSQTPEYYVGGIEPLDFIESWGMDFAEGNVVKYLTRYRHKHSGPIGQLEDLYKARAYLDRIISWAEAEAQIPPEIEPPFGTTEEGLSDA